MIPALGKKSRAISQRFNSHIYLSEMNAFSITHNRIRINIVSYSGVTLQK